MITGEVRLSEVLAMLAGASKKSVRLDLSGSCDVLQFTAKDGREFMLKLPKDAESASENSADFRVRVVF